MPISNIPIEYPVFRFSFLPFKVPFSFTLMYRKSLCLPVLNNFQSDKCSVDMFGSKQSDSGHSLYFT